MEESNNELTLFRVLDASRDAVWHACKERDALQQWWSMPHGVTMPVCELNFEVGGAMHFATHRPGRPLMWFKCIYRQIVEQQRLVLELHRSDEDGGEQDSSEWPASTIELEFEELNDKTRLKVVHRGMVSQRASVEDYEQGWSETLERLSTCLASRDRLRDRPEVAR